MPELSIDIQTDEATKPNKKEMLDYGRFLYPEIVKMLSDPYLVALKDHLYHEKYVLKKEEIDPLTLNQFMEYFVNAKALKGNDVVSKTEKKKELQQKSTSSKKSVAVFLKVLEKNKSIAYDLLNAYPVVRN